MGNEIYWRRAVLRDAFCQRKDTVSSPDFDKNGGRCNVKYFHRDLLKAQSERNDKTMNADQRKDIGTVDAGAFENADESQKARERRTSVREVVTQIAQGFLWSLLGYLFGICGLPFGAYPLGMALLCAADKKTPYILAGVCLSAIQSDKPVVWVCAYLAAFIIRILVRLTVDMPATEENDGVLTMAEVAPKLFAENVFLRMATSCVGVFIIGIYKLIEGGFCITICTELSSLWLSRPPRSYLPTGYSTVRCLIQNLPVFRHRS